MLEEVSFQYLPLRGIAAGSNQGVEAPPRQQPSAEPEPGRMESNVALTVPSCRHLGNLGYTYLENIFWLYIRC